jgi:hypothetical protein
MSSRVAIADALVTRLTALHPGAGITRQLVHILDPDEFTSLQVHVVPRLANLGPKWRSSGEMLREVSIHVIINAAPHETTLLASAANLTDAIHDSFVTGVLRDEEIAGADFQSIELIEAYDEELMRASSLYRTYLLVTYRITP